MNNERFLLTAVFSMTIIAVLGCVTPEPTWALRLLAVMGIGFTTTALIDRFASNMKSTRESISSPVDRDEGSARMDS